MILGTKNSLTSMCKNLHTFLSKSALRSFGQANQPKCKPSTGFLILYKNLLSKKMNEMIFTDSFSRMLFQMYNKTQRDVASHS